MDLGLDRLVEMIEQRFGKFAGTAVLLSVTVGAFAWGVRSFFAYLVLPVVTHGAQFVTYVRGLGFKMAAIEFLSAVAAVALFLIAVAIGRRLLYRETDDAVARVLGLIEQAQILLAKEVEREKAAKSHPASHPPSPAPPATP